MRKLVSFSVSRLVRVGQARALTMAPGQVGHSEINPHLEYDN